MNLAISYLPIAGCLIMMLGLGCGLGGAALWRGKPEDWRDVVARDDVVKRTARALVGMSVLLLVSGAATFLRLRWGPMFGALFTLFFVVGGFWGNHAIFGDFRPKHTGTNVVLACAIWLLIWFESSSTDTAIS